MLLPSPPACGRRRVTSSDVRRDRRHL